jgi:hypothetical protein
VTTLHVHKRSSLASGFVVFQRVCLCVYLQISIQIRKKIEQLLIYFRYQSADHLVLIVFRLNHTSYIKKNHQYCLILTAIITFRTLLLSMFFYFPVIFRQVENVILRCRRMRGRVIVFSYSFLVSRLFLK